MNTNVGKRRATSSATGNVVQVHQARYVIVVQWLIVGRFASNDWPNLVTKEIMLVHPSPADGSPLRRSCIGVLGECLPFHILRHLERLELELTDIIHIGQLAHLPTDDGGHFFVLAYNSGRRSHH